MSSNMLASSAVEHVGSGRLDDRAQAPTAELLWRGLEHAAPLGQPRRYIGPPGSLLGLGSPQPFGGVCRVVLVHLEARLGVAGRVDERGDVPARREHEAR